MEGMFALSREEESDGPLALYLQLNEIDRHRASAESAQPRTRFVCWRRNFPVSAISTASSPNFTRLNDASIARFLSVAQSVDRISNHPLRSNAVGIFQSNVSLWEILARQGQLPPEDLNQAWLDVVTPFADVKSSAQLFDAGHASFTALIRRATGKDVFNQDDVIALLAGPPAPRNRPKTDSAFTLWWRIESAWLWTTSASSTSIRFLSSRTA